MNPQNMNKIEQIITYILGEYGVSNCKPYVMFKLHLDPKKAERIYMKIKEIMK